MEKVTSPCSSSAGAPQSATTREESETPSSEASGESVSYGCAGCALHPTSESNAIVYENGAPGTVQGTT